MLLNDPSSMRGEALNSRNVPLPLYWAWFQSMQPAHSVRKCYETKITTTYPEKLIISSKRICQQLSHPCQYFRPSCPPGTAGEKQGWAELDGMMGRIVSMASLQEETKAQIT